MLIPFLIMLREGIEAALIVGIIASYLKQTGRGAWMPAVWLGILLAMALSLFVGAGLQMASADLPQKIQELFEALVGIAAAAVLTSMVFWMRRAARSIRGELQASVDAALSGPKAGTLALVGMVFLAVAREGVESAFFLLALVQQSPDNSALIGALAGLLVAVALGYGIYAGGVRLNLRAFFRWTGVFILIFAAGILAGAIRSLHEAGLWNHLQQTAFDLSAVMPADSPLGTLFSGLFGYRDTPAVGEVLAYAAFLIVSLFLFLSPRGALAPARPSAS